MRSRGREPLDLAQVGLAAAHGRAVEEAPAAHDGVVAAQMDELAGELQEGLLLVVQVPVDPRQLVVLAVRVVVALLRAAEFVAVGDHRHALGEDQRREEVALLAAAQAQDLLVVGGPLGPAVPRAVVVGPVGASLQVRLVVLRVVGHQVRKCEAVVGDDEVDGRPGLAARGLVQVRGARQAGGEVRQ